MTTMQSAEVEMFRKVREFLRQYPTIVDSSVLLKDDVTGFMNHLSALDDKVKSVNDAVELTGEDKINLRKRITDETLRLLSFLSHHALKSDNKMLKKLTDTKSSTIKQMTDADFIEFCKQVDEKIVENKAILLQYRVSEDTQTALLNKIEIFRSVKPQVGLNQAKQTILNGDIATGVQDLKKFLSNSLDKVVPTVNDTNPDFVRLYNESRFRRDPSKSVTQLILNVVDANNNPLSNVTVFVAELNLTDKTDDKGQVTFKVGNQTELTCTISKASFKNETAAFSGFKRSNTSVETMKMQVGEMMLINIK